MEAMAAGGNENSLSASHIRQSKLCRGEEQYGIQHPSDGGGRGGQKRKRGRAGFLRTPPESARDNYIAEAKVRHKTQRRWRKDDREGRRDWKSYRKD